MNRWPVKSIRIIYHATHHGVYYNIHDSLHFGRVKWWALKRVIRLRIQFSPLTLQCHGGSSIVYVRSPEIKSNLLTRRLSKSVCSKITQRTKKTYDFCLDGKNIRTVVLLQADYYGCCGCRRDFFKALLCIWNSNETLCMSWACIRFELFESIMSKTCRKLYRLFFFVVAMFGLFLITLKETDGNLIENVSSINWNTIRYRNATRVKVVRALVLHEQMTKPTSFHSESKKKNKQIKIRVRWKTFVNMNRRRRRERSLGRVPPRFCWNSIMSVGGAWRTNVFAAACEKPWRERLENAKPRGALARDTIRVVRRGRKER